MRLEYVIDGVTYRLWDWDSTRGCPIYKPINK